MFSICILWTLVIRQFDVLGICDGVFFYDQRREIDPCQLNDFKNWTILLVKFIFCL